MVKLLAILMMVFSVSVFADDGLVPYKIINKEKLHNLKLSLDVQVPVIDGRLPTEKELGDLSLYLANVEGAYERVFVVYYLPEMVLDAGGFATAHHNPTMEVQMIEMMLLEYPSYYYLIPDIRKRFPDYEPRI